MFRVYCLFCSHSGVPRFPICEDTLVLYTTYLSRRMGYKAIRGYFSALRHHCIIRNIAFNLLGMDRLYLLFRGIRRSQGSSHSRPLRLPITTYHLIQIHNYLQSPRFSSYSRRLYWSAATLAFFGLLRVSEYTSPTTTSFNSQITLLRSDILLVDNVLRIFIKCSKTDPFRQGCRLTIGRTNDLFCPVMAMTYFLQSRSHFYGPLFRFEDGTFLTRQRVATLLFNACNNIRINTHSFRIGGATALSVAGYSDSQIQIIGRWNSNCFVRYLRLSSNYVSESAQKMACVHIGDACWNNY